MLAFDATGYVLIEEDTRPAGKNLIVVDVDVLTNHIPARQAQARFRNSWRETNFVTRKMNRKTFLTSIGLQQFCLGEHDRCILKHRDQVWQVADATLHTLLDGDFLHVQMLQRENEIPFHMQYRWAQEGRRFENFQERWAEHNRPPEESNVEEETSNDTSSLIEMTTHSSTRSQVAAVRATENLIMQDENATLNLLQRRSTILRPSDASIGRERLPPPGNGVVKFTVYRSS